MARLLEFLAENAGQSVSRDELMKQVWPDVVVGDEALTNAVTKLRKALGDNHQKARYIETIPKMGYRLVAQVREAGAREDGTQGIFDDRSGSDQPGRQSRVPGPTTLRLAAVFIILAAGLVAAIALVMNFPTSTEDKGLGRQYPLAGPTDTPTIAVLPFSDLSDDARYAFFAEGITDDLTTGLAKNRDLLVIARDSSFFYREQNLRTADLAKRLNVRYLVQGSVRRVGDQLRINAQLVEADRERLVWAERFDGQIEDIFDFQNQITEQIAAALALSTDEPRRDRGPWITKNIDAYDKFLLGRNAFYLYANKGENQTARAFYQDAIDLDPNFAAAYSMLAWTHVFDAMNGWSGDREASLSKAISLANKAIQLDADQPIAFFVSGLAYRERKEYIKAMVDAEKALKLDPNYANAHMLLATLLYYAGRPEEGLERIKSAMRLHPHHPYNYSFHLGQVYFVLKRYDAAIDALEDAVDRYPSSERLHVWLAAAYAYAGNQESAEWEVAQIMTINPEFSLDRVKKSYPFKDDAERDRFLRGLIMAGVKSPE